MFPQPKTAFYYSKHAMLLHNRGTHSPVYMGKSFQYIEVTNLHVGNTELLKFNPIQIGHSKLYS